MIQKQTADPAISAFLAGQSNRWSFGNGVLYQMCAEHPLHTDADTIAGKIWLIGRSYSAAIERRKGATQSSDDFYHEVVAPKLVSVGRELDERIGRLNQLPHPTDETLEAVLETHKFLTDIFFALTNLEKRSLASKYLHFHCPKMFYIYDARARDAVAQYVAKTGKRTPAFRPDGYDACYTDFCLRMLELQAYIEETTGKLLSARALDNFLLKY